MIKQQFEEIIKDTKILCELEPFIKKWSFSEMSPHFEITNAIDQDNKLTVAEILRDMKGTTQQCDDDYSKRKCERETRESLLRKLKGEERNVIQFNSIKKLNHISRIACFRKLNNF